MTQSVIALAGATGDLGSRITRALIARGATVHALTRTDASEQKVKQTEALGATVVRADMGDVNSVATACEGAACVVSALNGLHSVIIDRQSVLLEATVKAGVLRFISSDYSLDFTKTTPGHNRNLDLRREFMARADRAPIKVTSVLNGAFMDMLGAEMPVIQPRLHRILYWRDAEQPLDFTTKDDSAAYTAAAALDDTTPRILRIASDTVTTRELAEAMSNVTDRRYRPLRVGGMGSLRALIRITKRVAPQPGEPFPAWQGMQYMRDMFSGRGKLAPLDNSRYPELRWTSADEYLAGKSWS